MDTNLMGWCSKTIHFEGKETAGRMKTENGIAVKIETLIEMSLNDTFEVSGKQYQVIGRRPLHDGFTYFIEEINSSEGKDAE